MKRSMPPIKLSMYRLWLAIGTFSMLVGVVMAVDVLTGGFRLAAQGDIWILIIPFGFGVAFVLQAVLRRRYVGIEEDDTPGWGQLAGALGLAVLAGFGGTEWLDGTFGEILGTIIFTALILLALGAATWLPRPWGNKGAKGG